MHARNLAQPTREGVLDWTPRGPRCNVLDASFDADERLRGIMYDKLPMFIGQIIMKNYVPGPAVSFAAIGDASSDQAPLQVGQFEADNRLDDVLSKIWIEEGGGGTGQESYELAAYFYARHSVLDCLQAGRKGFFFFLGDEGFYPKVSREQVRRVLGREESQDLDARTIFAELAQKYHVFFIYPQKSMAERRSDIDAEIKKRVEAAGGIYEGVDVRASLIWDNRNDLDLHIITPRGEHIYYANKRSTCSGWLDVDMNVRGETTKPVENIRWARGVAQRGPYRVYVQNYRFHEPSQGPTAFKVELEIGGEVCHFEGEMAAARTGAASDVTVFEFHYDPAQQAASLPRNVARVQHRSDAQQWNLVPGAWAPLSGITLSPNYWGARALEHHGRHAFFLVQGCRDLTADQKRGRGFFVESLRSEFHPIRATLEAFARTTEIAGAQEADACGLGMSDQKQSWNVVLRVTTRDSVATYLIDRWE